VFKQLGSQRATKVGDCVPLEYKEISQTGWEEGRGTVTTKKSGGGNYHQGGGEKNTGVNL